MKTFTLIALAACSSASREPKPRNAASPRPVPGQDGATLAAPRTCGAPGGTRPPSPVVQLTTGTESCARLADRSVWCWGESGAMRTDGDVLAAVGCGIAMRVDALADADDLWQFERDTCVATKRAVRCARLPEGFADPAAFGGRAAFQWNGVPCVITSDAKIRCYRDDETKLGAALAPVDRIVLRGTELCALSKTTVTCRRRDKGTVVATDVKLVSGGDWLWGVRTDSSVVRCDDNACSIPVSGVREPIAIASMGVEACVLSRDGGVACTRCPPKGPCDDTLRPVDGITDATQIAVGLGHACALRSSGEVVCWGASNCGQAGGDVEAGKPCDAKRVVLPPTTIRWAR